MNFDDLPETPQTAPLGAAPPLMFDALLEGPSASPPKFETPNALPKFDFLPQPPAVTTQLAPEKRTQADEKTNLQVPGFWSTVGSSFMRGVAQRAVDDLAGAKVVLPAGLGGQSLEEQYQSGLVNPETKDEIDGLLGKKVNEGWTDPKWWGAQVAHGTGGMVPAVGAASVGALARVPVPVSFGLEGGLGTLVPAYKTARAAGLEPEAAVTRAIIDSGIAASTAAAMGLAPSISFFGKNTSVINEQVAETLKRPVMEMLAQLGLVQPGLAVTGEIVKDLSHAEIPDPWGLATTFVVGAAQGVPIVGMHAVREANAVRKAAATPPAVPASPEVVAEVGAAQAAPGAPVRPDAPPAPEGFVANEQDVVLREDRIFFSRLRRVAEQDLPESASATQVIATLRNKGVREEEMIDAGLPAYLADPNGRVNKKDLLAHLESNAVQLEEVQTKYNHDFRLEDFEGAAFTKYGARYDLWPQEIRDQHKQLELQVATDAENFRKQYREPEYAHQVLPGEHSNYREVILKVPPRGEAITREFDPTSPKGWQFTDEGYIAKPELDPRLNFLASHFPDVNIIAHARLTDRVGRNGEHLLHVEETQSDLHQKGRKQGYVDLNIRPIEVLRNERQAFNREHTDLTIRFPGAMTAPDRYMQNKMFGRIPQEVLNYMDRRSAHSKEYEAALNNEGRAPNLPFKTSWEELVVKRLLRMAADEGYDGISWANGDQIGLRLSTPEQLNGNRQFYNKKLSSLFAKWAKKMGMDVDQTVFPNSGSDAPTFNPIHIDRLRKMGLDHTKMDNTNYFVKLNPAAADRIRQGLPLYETGPEQAGGGLTLNQAIQKGNPKEMKQHIEPMQKLLGQLGKDMKISRPINFQIGPMRTSWRGRARAKNGEYQIFLNTRLLGRVEDFYATAMHELGHVIMWDKFAKAPDNIKTAISAAYREFRNSLPIADLTVGDLRRVRDNPISEMTEGRNLMTAGRMSDTIPLSDLIPKSRAYMLHFEEWFAEQTAKWGATSEKPLSRVDKFFKTLGDSVRKLIERFRGERSTPAEAVPVMQEWLNSLVNDKGNFASDILDLHELNTKRSNADALNRDGTPEVPATSHTASTIGGRSILDSLPPGASSGGHATAAHADRMNKFYEWMTSLPQITEMNKHIRGLVNYKEIVATMNIEKNNIMGAAHETLRQWKAIKDKTQQVSIGKFIEDYMNGHFKLVDDGLIRRPTTAEFSALAAKHRLSDQSIRLFDKVRKDFDDLLETYRGLLLDDAFRIKDPAAQLDAIQTINKRVDTLRERPYFPAMRFGKYIITVYDSANNVRHFEQTESLAKQRKIAEALTKSPDLLPGDRVRTGEVPKDAAPLLGMPPGLIDLIANKLSLSDTQKGMLDQLRFDYAPSQSFRHQFRQKDLTPGYSSDFQRAYANFFFHGANHITRVKWVDSLRDQIREVKEGSIDLDDANKRDRISNYLTEHLSMLVDPKPDFAALRGLMFHWYLGFNPASATLNLSQTPLMTYPHLASKFGDISSVGALMKASSELNNFYKKGTIQDLAKNAPPGPTGAKLRAISEAIKEGVISETQAHTLAAVSEGRNLLRAFGSKGEEGWHRFSEASSWMFEMAEQYNRRVAFRAAWELGMKAPNNKYVAETIRDNPLQYKRLLDQGWSHQEAAAFTAAKDSVEKSQFVYAPYARPKFMWGRKGALFIFKSFVQNTLFNLWSNPSMAARHLIILGAVGGLMGLPGTEDINGLLKGLAWHLFGKDFDLEDHARKFAIDVLDGHIAPDMLLHGTSVRGFGIPHVMNGMGAMVGLPKFFPELDRSNSVSMGNLLPFETGKLLGPSKDPKGRELQQLQRAAGPAFSLAFAPYKFLNSSGSLGDLKRWEELMPRWAGNLSHAWRYFREGRERDQAGNTVLRFDVGDTEHMAEILARGLGYQPHRLTGVWETREGKQEAAVYWELRQQILLRQFAESVKSQDSEGRALVLDAIRKYNQSLPKEVLAAAITAKTLKDSVMQRLKTQQKQEAGMPLSKKYIQLYQSLDKYFPEGRPTGQVDARPVK